MENPNGVAHLMGPAVLNRPERFVRDLTAMLPFKGHGDLFGQGPWERWDGWRGVTYDTSKASITIYDSRGGATNLRQ